MKKIDSAIKKETLFVSAWVIILSVIMEAVFLIIQKWDYTVLLGNLLTAGFSVLNFFLMGLTVQGAVGKEQKEAKSAMKASQSLRTLMMFVVLIVGVVAPCFNIWATIIPIFFPRIAMVIRTFSIKK